MASKPGMTVQTGPKKSDTKGKKRAKGTKASKPSAVARRQRNLAINEFGSDVTDRIARKDRHVQLSSHMAFLSRADMAAKRYNRVPPPRAPIVGPRPWLRKRWRLRWDNPQPRCSLVNGVNVNDVLYEADMFAPTR